MTESNQGPATPGTAARCEDDLDLIDGALGLEPYIGGNNRRIHEAEAAVSRLRASLERLKAENASLLESLHESEAMAGHEGDKRIRLADQLAAAEQRAEAAEKRRDELTAELEQERKWHYEQSDRAHAAEQNYAGAKELIEAGKTDYRSLLAQARAAAERAAAAEQRAADLMGALRAALGTMQGPMAEMEKRCVLDRPHDHGHLRALRAAMRILQDAHDAALHDEERSAPRLATSAAEPPQEKEEAGWAKALRKYASAAQGEEK